MNSRTLCLAIVSISASFAALGMIAPHRKVDATWNYNDIVAARDDSWLHLKIPAAVTLWGLGVICLVGWGCDATPRSRGVAMALALGALLSAISGIVLLRSL